MSGSPPSEGRSYRAFISYSPADKTWADWLHKALETYRIPARLVGTHIAAGTLPRRPNPIPRDRGELASAAALICKINEALAQSEDLIVPNEHSQRDDQRHGVTGAKNRPGFPGRFSQSIDQTFSALG